MLEQEGQPNLILIYVVRVQLRKDFTVDLDGSIQGEGYDLLTITLIVEAVDLLGAAQAETVTLSDPGVRPIP